MVEDARISADMVTKPISWDRVPPVVLDHEEQEQFGSLNWANPTSGMKDAPEVDILGIKRIVVGRIDGVTIITRNDDGQLVKREINQEDVIHGQLGGGISGEERIIYVNDPRIMLGSGDRSTMSDIKVYFRKRVSLDKDVIEDGMSVALELIKTVEQDRTSRMIRQAQVDLQRRFSKASDSQLLRKMIASLEQVLKEAAIDEETVSESRQTLPAKIRELGEKMREMGIKMVEDNYFRKNFALWPSGIKRVWKVETDDIAWDDWNRLPRDYSEDPPEE